MFTGEEESAADEDMTGLTTTFVTGDSDLSVSDVLVWSTSAGLSSGGACCGTASL